MPIIRIVKMSFRPEEIDRFTRMFDERKERIRSFPGCQHLELWQDEKENNTFVTYSIWEDEQHLDHYRFSTFFKETWGLTKALFLAKAEAWTLHQRVTGKKGEEEG
ncbi:MAG: antibiotic biosynthesis monooxygenase [Chitinophagaceae bacterium]|nr:antibiotic biosynthesis monooxygenase [Chitinophagaceae bacterium]